MVKIAARCLASDIAQVTGTSPSILNSTTTKTSTAVFIGTLGKSPVINALVQAKKLHVARVRGQWESYSIATVSNPVPGIKHGLVLVGSDQRGTAYAAFTLSQAIGVSPWEWWADVHPTPKKRSG